MLEVYTRIQVMTVPVRDALTVSDERGEVNTAAILAWVVVAVLVIMGGKVAWDNLINDGVDKVRTETGL